MLLHQPFISQTVDKPASSHWPSHRSFYATLSDRYHYRVLAVGQLGQTTATVGEVYLDGRFLCKVLRLEHLDFELEQRASLTTLYAQVRLVAEGFPPTLSTLVRLHCNPRSRRFCVEIWDELEPPKGSTHDFRVMQLIGFSDPITRNPILSAALHEPHRLERIEITFLADKDGRTLQVLEPMTRNISLESY
jgi:hypothetical protein